MTEDDIRLVARSGPKKPVVLRAAGDQDEGTGVGRTADPDCLSDASKRVRGSLVAGFTVEGFEEDGVFLFCARTGASRDTLARDNLEYGIFPSHVVRGRVDHSFASGANAPASTSASRTLCGLITASRATTSAASGSRTAPASA